MLATMSEPQAGRAPEYAAVPLPSTRLTGEAQRGGTITENASELGARSRWVAALPINAPRNVWGLLEWKQRPLCCQATLKLSLWIVPDS